MGILSTFCAAVLVLVLDRIVSADKGHLVELWAKGYLFIIVGSGLMLFAALFFYRQRSLLAWYYGQISLCIAKSSEGIADWLRESDSWATWIYYRIAFAFLIVAFVEYGLALLSLKIPNIQKCQYTYAQLPVWTAIIVLTPWLWILSKYRYEESPIKHFVTMLRKRRRRPRARL